MITHKGCDCKDDLKLLNMTFFKFRVAPKYKGTDSIISVQSSLKTHP